MTQGRISRIDYGQLHDAGIIRSKGEFSERLLGKSPSYLTSMRAKQRVISSDIIMGLGDNLMAEIGELGSDPAHAKMRALLRRAVALVNNYLADQTIPTTIVVSTNLKLPRRPSRLSAWLRTFIGNPC
jgi:hypothetical protein